MVRARNFSKSQSLFRKEKLGIESSEFFQVPELIGGGGGGARNFSKAQSLYRGEELGIFRPRAHVREGGELEIFPSSKAYIGGGVVIIPKPQ